MPLSAEKKAKYFEKLKRFLSEYTKVFIVTVDNVGSKQMQQIRMAIRGDSEVLMGKNTLIRKIFKEFLEENPGHPMGALYDHIGGNCGFVFTNGDLGDVRKLLLDNVVPAPARVGAVAPCDVICPPGPTGCDPGQTSFFQALNIATKISKGQIEITTEVLLTPAGEKVGNSEAVLCQKLNIMPFTYGLVVATVYDNGSVFSPSVLDLTDEILTDKFMSAVKQVASISLALGQPSLASLPHHIVNAYQNLLALAVEVDGCSFEKAEPYIAAMPKPKPEKKEEEAPAEEAAAPAPAAAADY